MIPYTIAPFTLSLERMAMIIRERMATAAPIIVAPSVENFSRLKETSVTFVDVSNATMPAFCMPTKAMNSPMPAGMARRIACGTERTIISRAPTMVRMRNSTPEQSTMSSAFA